MKNIPVLTVILKMVNSFIIGNAKYFLINLLKWERSIILFYVIMVSLFWSNFVLYIKVLTLTLQGQKSNEADFYKARYIVLTIFRTAW